MFLSLHYLIVTRSSVGCFGASLSGFIDVGGSGFFPFPVTTGLAGVRRLAHQAGLYGGCVILLSV